MQILNQIHLTSTDETSLFASEYVDECIERLAPEQERILAARTRGYYTDYAALALPEDAQACARIEQQVARSKALAPTVLVLVGIGGSHLGTRAVYEACQGLLHNELAIPKLYYADTVDSHGLQQLLQLLAMHAASGASIMVILISKSGTTIESLGNFQLLRVFMECTYANWTERIVVITDDASPLQLLAEREGFACLPIPPRVGGRFSVLSAVGLFPLALLGIDIQELCAGALHARQEIYAHAHNSAAISAALIFMHAAQGRFVHDTFLFSPRLAGMGAWYRQLLAESIGKNSTRAGLPIAAGVLPTVSIGSTDLHSMVQLYLAGPDTLFTSFVAVEQEADMITVPAMNSYAALAPTIQGKSLAAIMQAILHGTQRAYAQKKRPFITWHLPCVTPAVVGQFLMYKMVEILYLGHLYNVNPFDQPQVELYKQETRRLLTNE